MSEYVKLLPLFQRYMLPPSSGYKNPLHREEALCSSKTLVISYQATQYHIPEHTDLHSHPEKTKNLNVRKSCFSYLFKSVSFIIKEHSAVCVRSIQEAKGILVTLLNLEIRWEASRVLQSKQLICIFQHSLECGTCSFTEILRQTVSSWVWSCFWPCQMNVTEGFCPPRLSITTVTAPTPTRCSCIQSVGYTNIIATR